MLVLSLFPGIGLLDRAFEEEGFCVVRGPDLLWGGDVRSFHPPAGCWSGVIGGPPCKAHTPLANVNRVRWGEGSVALDLIPEYERVVGEAAPTWFLMENVRRAPLPNVPGYQVRDVVLNNRMFGGVQNRERRLSFGTRDGRRLSASAIAESVRAVQGEWEPAVTATNGGRGHSGPWKPINGKLGVCRTIEEAALLQGLPADFLADAPFTVTGKREAIANGVPLPMGRAVARAVKRALECGERAA